MFVITKIRACGYAEGETGSVSKKGYSKSYSIDMCNGPLAKKLFLFAIPLMLSGTLQLLFTAMDMIVVGRYAGEESLAAVGSNGALVHLLVGMFAGLSVGSNIIIARDIGAKREEDISRDVNTSMAVATIGGIGMTIFGLIMSRQLLLWTNSPTDVIDLATTYLRIYFLSMPAMMYYNFGAMMLRAQGDTKRPLYYLTFAGIINVGLNLILVINFHLGVVGVAVATVVSQYISAILVVRCMILEKGPLHFEPKDMRIDWDILKRLMHVGLPAGAQGMMFALSNVVIQSGINSFNDAVIVAGSAAASNIEGFVYSAMNSFQQTASTFASQNYGAGKCKRVDKVLLECVGYIVATAIILGYAAYYNGEFLLSIYAPNEPAVVEQGMVRLGYVCKAYFLCGIMDVIVGVLRSIGFTIGPMITALVGICGLRIAWVKWIFPLNRVPASLYFSFMVSWLVTGTIHLVFFLCVRKKTYRKVGYNGENCNEDSTESLLETVELKDPETISKK